MYFCILSAHHLQIGCLTVVSCTCHGVTMTNLYKIAPENLVSLRKYRKMTQADMAGELKVSLRKYIDFENPSVDKYLPSLDLINFSAALKIGPHMLLDELPFEFTSHWKKVSYISQFSKVLLKAKGDLQVSGLPLNKKLRTSLIEVVQMYERCKSEQDEDLPLSESLQQQFRCDDLLEKLIGSEAEGIEALATADLYSMPVPMLKMKKSWYYPYDNDTTEDYYRFEWSFRNDLLIDFDRSANNRPLTFPLIYSDDLLDLHMAKEDDPEEYAKMVQQALSARPEIPQADNDEHIFQTEPYKNPEPTVDEARMTVKAGSASVSVKNTKEDEEEPG